jgi:hypothetical protein
MKRITLATLHEATAQEVFDQVAVHLMTQGKKSMRYGTCVYRGDNGIACAAGCLISDDEFDDHTRTAEFGFNSARWSLLIKAGIAPAYHEDLIRKLQNIHDAHFVETWPAMLRGVANISDLNAAVLDQFGKQE